MGRLNDYDSLIKVLDKERISMSDLRSLTDSELVASVEEAKTDEKHKFYYKYDIRLTNGELYYVYVKKSPMEILKILTGNK